jgi:hypothetical protein
MTGGDQGRLLGRRRPRSHHRRTARFASFGLRACRHGKRRVLKLRPHQDGCTALVFQAFGMSRPRRWIITHGHLANLIPRNFRNTIKTDALIVGHRAMASNVNAPRFLVDRGVLVLGEVIVIRVPITEVGQGDKRVEIGPESKVEPDVDMPAMVIKPKSAHIGAMGRQRRPTTLVGSISPGDPRRPPIGVRPPHPTRARVTEPPSIMEGRPTPGIVRIPVPTVIGPQPASMGGIGPP